MQCARLPRSVSAEYWFRSTSLRTRRKPSATPFRLRASSSASIHLVYVVEPTVYPADLGFGQVVYPTFEEELVEKGKEELQSLLREEIGTPAGSSAVVRTGKPHQEILLEAEDRHADLIIMATHGHTGVEHMLFGSTAERIVRNAKCPVLTIRPTEK